MNVEDSVYMFTLVALLFGTVMIGTIYLSVRYFFLDELNETSWYMFISIGCSFIIPFVLNICGWLNNIKTFIIGTISFIFLVPTFLNVFVIYAFCNIHDMSWGTRESNSDTAKQKEREFKAYRSKFLITWLVFNMFISFLINFLWKKARGNTESQWFIFILGVIIAILIFLKVFFSTIHRIRNVLYMLVCHCRCFSCCCREEDMKPSDYQAAEEKPLALVPI